MNARLAAYTVLNKFVNEKENLEDAVDAVFSANRISPRDRSLAFEIIYGTIRQKLYLDHLTDARLNSKFHGEKKLRIIIETALYQIIYLDKIPNHSAVDEAVKLTKDVANFGLSRVVNGVLRTIERDLKANAIPLDPAMAAHEKLAVKYSHPAPLVKKWLADFGKAKTVKLLKFNNKKPDMYIRRSLTNTNEPRFVRDLADVLQKRFGMGYRKLYFKLKPGIKPVDLESFQAGHLTVQSPSSGWAVSLLECHPGETVLDMCAAPGGKTTLIADIVGETGRVVAADLKSGRILRIRQNMKRMLQKNIFAFVQDANRPAVRGTFHKILLDAPCSGTGVMHRHPDSRLFKSQEDIERLAELQKRILRSAAELLAPGGVLVYATCSIEYEENQGVVEGFLKEFPAFYLERAQDFAEADYCDSAGYLNIKPFRHGTDGMFAARLVKKGDA
ncbi:MAG: 16S rRNA (cytosine(967)-C(5))-methyltransferase RsmB [Fibrobacterota bacterium]